MVKPYSYEWHLKLTQPECADRPPRPAVPMSPFQATLSRRLAEVKARENAMQSRPRQAGSANGSKAKGENLDANEGDSEDDETRSPIYTPSSSESGGGHTPSSSILSSETVISAEPTRRKGALPRTSTMTRDSWVCCHCNRLNKTGKWLACQNPSENPTPFRKERCRHERCVDCSPKRYGAMQTPFITRRWDTKELYSASLHPQLTTDAWVANLSELAILGAWVSDREVVEEIVESIRRGKIERGEIPEEVVRDPLTGLRIGKWPGKF